MSLLTKTTTQNKSPFYKVNPFVLLGACSSQSYLPRGSFRQYVFHPHVAGGGSWYSPSVSLWRQRAEEADLPGAIWRTEWQRQEGSSGLVCASLCSCCLRSKQPLSFGASVTDRRYINSLAAALVLWQAHDSIPQKKAMLSIVTVVVSGNVP